MIQPTEFCEPASIASTKLRFERVAIAKTQEGDMGGKSAAETIESNVGNLRNLRLSSIISSWVCNINRCPPPPREKYNYHIGVCARRSVKPDACGLRKPLRTRPVRYPFMLATQTGLGRESAEKVSVVGARDCTTRSVKALSISNADAQTLQGFVHDAISPDAQVLTDGHNGHGGTFRDMSERHLQRYAKGLAGRHNDRDADTVVQLGNLARNMEGKRFRFGSLVG